MKLAPSNARQEPHSMRLLYRITEIYLQLKKSVTPGGNPTIPIHKVVNYFHEVVEV